MHLRARAGVIVASVVLVVSGCAGALPSAAPGTPSTTSTRTPRTIAPSVTPSSSTTGLLGPGTASLNGDVTADVVVASSSTAYIDVGVAATRRLYVTTDAGAHVHEVREPSVAGSTLQASRLVFPTPTTGYAVLGDVVDGSTLLLRTTDGARSWQQVALPATAGAIAGVAGHGSRVYVATLACASGTPCRQVQIWSASVGSADFARISTSLPARDAGTGVGLAGWGDSLWLMLGGGSTSDPVTVTSTDAGASLTTRPGPVGVRCSPVATSAQAIWTSCSTGMSMSFQRVSGSGAEVTLDVGGSGTAGTFLDPVSDDVAFFGSEAGQWAGLYVTHDAGLRFTKVSDGPPGYLSSAWSPNLRFLSPSVGLTVGDGFVLYRTTDSGVTWRPVDVPSS